MIPPAWEKRLPKLPRITGREVVAALKRLGFREVRSRGSHLTLWRESTDTVCTVPMHASETLAPKTLQSILEQAQISTETLRNAL